MNWFSLTDLIETNFKIELNFFTCVIDIQSFSLYRIFHHHHFRFQFEEGNRNGSDNRGLTPTQIKLCLPHFSLHSESKTSLFTRRKKVKVLRIFLNWMTLHASFLISKNDEWLVNRFILFSTQQNQKSINFQNKKVTLTERNGPEITKQKKSKHAKLVDAFAHKMNRVHALLS